MKEIIKRFLEKRREEKKVSKQEIADLKADVMWYRTKFMQLTDEMSLYKQGKNPYTTLRDISNILCIYKKGRNKNEFKG